MDKNNTNSKYQKKIITIPNFLSLCRLLMIPFMLWLYCVKEDYRATLIMLIISGVTDVVDGFIARRFNMVSDFGKAFDPLADKLTQIAMLFALVSRFKYMILPLVILVVKEIVAAIVGLLTIKKSGEVFSALWHGKVTTFLLYFTMAVHLIWYNIDNYPVISHLLILACTAMMLTSAVLYSARNIKIIISKEN